MIQISSVQALNDHLAGIPKVLEDPDSLLIDSMGVVVLSECAVVHVGQLAGDLPIVKQIVDIHLVDVASLV